MVIRHVAPESVARIYAALGAGVGLIAGIAIAFGVFFGGNSAFPSTSNGPSPVLALAALIVAPVAYAIISAIGGAISAIAYNVAADWFGGIEVELGAVAAGFDGQFFPKKDRS
jgi:hypothetical protein